MQRDKITVHIANNKKFLPMSIQPYDHNKNVWQSVQLTLKGIAQNFHRGNYLYFIARFIRKYLHLNNQPFRMIYLHTNKIITSSKPTFQTSVSKCMFWEYSSQVSYT